MNIPHNGTVACFSEYLYMDVKRLIIYHTDLPSSEVITQFDILGTMEKIFSGFYHSI